MNENTFRFAADRPFSSERWDSIPLARWWRLSVVGTVDHEKVLARVVDDSGLAARYIFMTMMSAGIAVLGLLLSSPAVVIGAMLISPLMGPILGLGFGLATFDFRELRRAGVAFVAGTVVAIAFTALIVLCSPLKAATTEIMARTRPNLFDLLVALFAALAGTFALIRGRGETIVGVAIATALMPPIAVVGYGLATWNMPVLGGSLALFLTNFMTIALAATIMARLYGFGHFLSSQQSWVQTGLLLLAFIGMSVPLGISLIQIAGEAVVVTQLRSALSSRFGPDSRVTQLEIDFDRKPWAVRSVVIAPRDKAANPRALRTELEKRLGRPLAIQVDQILLDPTKGDDAERVALERANAAATKERDIGGEIARIVAVAAGTTPERVTLDREHQRVVASAALLPGAGLAAYQALESRVTASVEGWSVTIVPPLLELPTISFTDGEDTLDEGGRRAVLLSAWAAKRWNVGALTVPDLPAADAEADGLPLAARRARTIAKLLTENGIQPVAGASQRGAVRLSAVTAESEL